VNGLFYSNFASAFVLHGPFYHSVPRISIIVFLLIHAILTQYVMLQ